MATSSSTAKKRKGDSPLTGDRNNINHYIQTEEKGKHLKFALIYYLYQLKSFSAIFLRVIACCPYIFGSKDLPSTKKELIEKVREKEKKRMTGEYYDIQLR